MICAVTTLREIGSILAAFLFTLLAVALYGVLHSLLASFRAKRMAERALGPGAARAYRLLYNGLAAVTFLPVLAVPATNPGTLIYKIGWPWVLLTGLLQLAAAGAVLVGIMQTGAMSFLGVRQLMGPPTREPTLVVAGLYRHVRHPLYTAGLVFIWLVPVMTTSVLALNLGLSAYLYFGSRFEERRLRAEFGEAYAKYQNSVPRLIPLPRRTWQDSNPESRPTTR